MTCTWGTDLDLSDLVVVRPVNPSGSAAATFAGTPIPGSSGRMFGGQLIGQAVMAASMSVHEHERLAHSLHAYFVRAGRVDLPVSYDVEMVRDGRSFSVRTVRAHQDGRLLMTAGLSFHGPREGLSHQTTWSGGYPDPESLSPDSSRASAQTRDGRPGHRSFVELRRVPQELTSEDSTRAGQAVWLRARLPHGERSDAVNRATLAMATDFTLLESIVLGHDVTFETPGIAVASLDHAIWWHAPASFDDWILYEQESPWAGGERGLAHGRLYDRSGRLLASAAQEGLVRVPELAVGGNTS
ncbi:acyl-CoA thioesterase domain-containing protein [Diaminobutyricimonas sp. TR449]|uniref:acyl-CoA thioesterase n=1 Tax=Diaminobutyricimonas sp. TR449 TaxID=2708076 RepID=UPI00141EB57C|nr:acyl-CoA thioesterase domain-containing protein [Diaminobutyricimonas sp. TR449]